MEVKSGRIIGWLLWGLAAMIMLSGCSLLECKDSGGRVDRLKLDTAETWDSYDDRPRLPYTHSGKHGLDDMGVVLKTEKTF